ncbi:MAG: metalloregulator ArsR/SmtB family transcription factor [Firmicutes bacterium]|nr:metalloregulator ArsR/SmtB family transcription factor [Bacillota bacterium]
MAERSLEAYSLWADFWQALSHPIRLRVLAALREEGPLNVGQLVDRLGIGQGHLSNHLACLKTCGLVTTESQGRYVYYRIGDDRVPALLDLGEAVFSDHWAGVATCAVVSQPPVPTRE